MRTVFFVPSHPIDVNTQKDVNHKRKRNKYCMHERINGRNKRERRIPDRENCEPDTQHTAPRHRKQKTQSFQKHPLFCRVKRARTTLPHPLDKCNSVALIWLYANHKRNFQISQNERVSVLKNPSKNLRFFHNTFEAAFPRRRARAPCET